MTEAHKEAMRKGKARAKRLRKRAEKEKLNLTPTRKANAQLSAEIQNHITYCFAKCESFIEFYSAGQTVSQQVIARGVAGLLLRTTGR